MDEEISRFTADIIMFIVVFLGSLKAEISVFSNFYFQLSQVGTVQFKLRNMSQESSFP